MRLITYSFRVKDSVSRKHLNRMARSVNFTWNYCNEVSVLALKNKEIFLSAFDLNKLTAGTSQALGINVETVQATCEEYATRRKQFKKSRLKWRSKKSPGWVPFKARSIKRVEKGVVKYYGHYFKFWETRPIGNIRCGSFSQNSEGKWFLNLVCEDTESVPPLTGKHIGVDLGLKTTATYSDGTSFAGAKSTRVYAEKLAKAQRAKKKKQVTKIHKKISNTRKDALHKETTRLVREFDKIVVGDVSSKKLLKTKMAKSVSDVSWSTYKSLLAYKTVRFGKEVKVVNESWTSRTCHVCGVIADFGGLSGLSVREWSCKGCGTTHDRDVNAAKNILRLGH